MWKNFRVFEDNAEQEVVTFSAEDVPSPSVWFSISAAACPAKWVKPAKQRVQILQDSQPAG
jgi:hypothetical protein